MLVKPEFGRSYTQSDCYNSVGEGWHSLIDKLFAEIDKTPVPVYITTCKEKFGGLRVYWYADAERQDLFTDEDFNTFDAFVIGLEEQSFRVCEACGQAGIPRKRSWIKTLCTTCYEEGI